MALTADYQLIDLDAILRPENFDWPPRVKVLEMRYTEGEFYDMPTLNIVAVLAPKTPDSATTWDKVKGVTRQIRQRLRAAGVVSSIGVDFNTEAQLAEKARPVEGWLDEEDEERAADEGAAA